MSAPLLQVDALEVHFPTPRGVVRAVDGVSFNLNPGEFVFRIYPREGSGTKEGNPRLDCLVLAEDPDFVPTDGDAEAAFRNKR